MPATYLETLAAFTDFLSAYVHTLLYLRNLYPRASFVQSRFHNTPVYQSRHPLVCEWIHDAIAAVREELLEGTVARIGIVIFSIRDENSSGRTGGDKGSVRIMERYMLDVSTFPVVEKSKRHMQIVYEESPAVDKKGKQKALDTDTEVNISEQFRAALVTLSTRTSRLASLPPNCSFNVAMELKDEGDIDPPIGHPKPWIPVQPSLQKTGRKGAQAIEGADREGQDLGGARVTPIRTVQAGVFRFETWIEEG